MLKSIIAKAKEVVTTVTSDEVKFVAKEMVKGLPGTARLMVYQKPINIFHPTEHVGTVGGYHIYEATALVNDMSGLPEGIPMAMATTSAVLVNKSFLEKLSKEHQNAILYHEIGHIELGHVDLIQADPDGYGLGATFGYGFGQRIEFEADEYARSRGYDIEGALRAILQHGHGFSTPCLARRLYRLQNAN